MAEPVKITFLGGLGQIGRNCAALEIGDELLILDCGQLFGDDTLPGVDAVLPNLDYLIERADRIVGCIATHAHEDHIGALPYLLAEIEFPIYGSPFTLGMIRNKLNEGKLLGRTDLRPVSDGDRIQVGSFDLEFLPVTHSTPAGSITVFRTPQGIILHSSDFKLDHTPFDGRVTDLGRIEELSNEPGIRLLLVDSTNADQPGQSASETSIGPVLSEIFAARPDRRIIVGAFSSHIHRLQQVIDAALENGRVVATLGLSMQKNIRLARDLGLLRIPDASLCAVEDIDDLPPGRVCIMCTGSQGEPRSALTLMAKGENRWVDLSVDDTVIFSSHPIPGNEAAIGRTRNGLARVGVEVIHSGLDDVHTTGHGKADELSVLHRAADAELFVPVHGEYSHLVAHMELARALGRREDSMLLCEDGDQLVLDDEGIHRIDQVAPGRVLVDGIAGHLDERAMDDRRLLAAGGFVAIVAVVDLQGGRIEDPVRIESRGWVDGPLLDELAAQAAELATEAIEKALAEVDVRLDDVERVARRAVGKFVNASTGRRPMIVPVISDF